MSENSSARGPLKKLQAALRGLKQRHEARHRPTGLGFVLADRIDLEPKAGRGAKPEPMAVWLRHRLPAVNWLVRGLLGAVPHAEAPERNPFKTVAAETTEPAN